MISGSASWMITPSPTRPATPSAFGPAQPQGFTQLVASITGDTPWRISERFDDWARDGAYRTWIDARESYAPTFPAGEGLEEVGAVEFTKVIATLAADVRLTERVGITLEGSWADYDDAVDDANDGSALGALVAVNVRW